MQTKSWEEKKSEFCVNISQFSVYIYCEKQSPTFFFFFFILWGEWASIVATNMIDELIKC